MNELKERLLDKRFLISIVGAAIIITVSNLPIFHFSNASSPQQRTVLVIFASYLFNAGALAFVYFVEAKSLREKLFVPFSILLLLLTVKFAAMWMSAGKVFPHLYNNTMWLYFQAFLNISFIPILISSFQVAKMAEKEEDKPFYALLIINYATIVLYLAIVAPLFSHLAAPRIWDVFLYQLALYAAMYFFFAYSLYFVSKGDFLKNFFGSVFFALKHFGITILIVFGILLIVYVLPFMANGLQNVANSQGLTVSFYRALYFLMPFVLYYVFPLFYIIATYIAKRYEQ